MGFFDKGIYGPYNWYALDFIAILHYVYETIYQHVEFIIYHLKNVQDWQRKKTQGSQRKKKKNHLSQKKGGYAQNQNAGS